LVANDFSALKADLVFHVPGTLEDSRGFDQQTGGVAYTVDGLKIVQSMDADVASNAFLTPMILAGKSLNPKDALNQKVFALKGEVWARWKGPFRPRFDYAAEADAAKKAQPAMMVKLGLEKPRTSSPSSAPTPTPITPAKPAPTETSPAKKPADSKPSGKGPPTVPSIDPTKIPTPILPF
jgi:hypothetical protein